MSTGEIVPISLTMGCLISTHLHSCLPFRFAFIKLDLFFSLFCSIIAFVKNESTLSVLFIWAGFLTDCLSFTPVQCLPVLLWSSSLLYFCECVRAEKTAKHTSSPGPGLGTLNTYFINKKEVCVWKLIIANYSCSKVRRRHLNEAVGELKRISGEGNNRLNKVPMKWLLRRILIPRIQGTFFWNKVCLTDLNSH